MRGICDSTCGIRGVWDFRRRIVELRGIRVIRRVGFSGLCACEGFEACGIFRATDLRAAWDSCD